MRISREDQFVDVPCDVSQLRHEVLHEVHEGKLPLPSSLYSIIRDPDSWNDPVLCC